MNRHRLAAWAAALCLAAPAAAQEKAPPEDPAHAKLRALRDEMLEAFNKRDVDGLLKHLHPDVVVTWQNGEVSRKHEGVRQYYQRMLLAPDSVVQSITIPRLDVAELSILYGRGKDKDTAVAWGTMEDQYRLRDGMEFNLHSRWTVTLVNEGDAWKVVEAHLSGNVFENEVLYAAVKRTALWTGLIALPVGLVLGFGGARLLRRRPPAGGPPA
jgi:ketosteroid isomerase-like protein